MLILTLLVLPLLLTITICFKCSKVSKNFWKLQYMSLFDQNNNPVEDKSYFFNKDSADSTKISFIQKPLEWSESDIEQVCSKDPTLNSLI